jgi:hypothetical protein
MRRSVFLISLLFLIAPHRSSGSWTWVDSAEFIRVADFYNAHLGLVAFGEVQGPLMRYADGTLTGVTDINMEQLAIQDSNRAWGCDNLNIFLGTAKWTIWSQTSLTVSSPQLIAATSDGLFFRADSNLYFTSDGIAATAATGIPHNDPIRAIDYLSKSTLIAVSATAIYRSTDGGLAWSRAASAPLRTNASVYADRVHGIVFTGGDNLRKSTDNGRTWNVVIPPPQFELLAIDGQVYGAHDCSGTFYVSGTNIMRSEDGGNTFVSTQPLPLGGKFLFLKGWTFDRGSTVFWQNNQLPYVSFGPLAVSHDGINGLLKDSVASAITVAADAISDTVCDANAANFSIRVQSSLCTGVRIDSIGVVRSTGAIGRKIAGKTLFNDSAQFSLTYAGVVGGIDSITLRVWLHSLEWGMKEFVDVKTTAVNVSLPPVLIATDKLDFGDVHIDSTKQMFVRISNSGCAALRVDSVVSSNPTLFTVASQIFPLSVPRDSARNIAVTFAPKVRGLALESIELGTNAGHRYIAVEGNGVTQEQQDVKQLDRSNILIGPNPAFDIIHIRGLRSVENVAVRDLLGRTMIEQNVDGVDTEVSVAALAPGMYVLTVGHFTSRIIISR